MILLLAPWKFPGATKLLEFPFEADILVSFAKAVDDVAKDEREVAPRPAEETLHNTIAYFTHDRPDCRARHTKEIT